MVTTGIVVEGLVGIVVGGTFVVVGIVVEGVVVAVGIVVGDTVIVPVVAEEDSVGTVAEDWDGTVGMEVPLVSGTDVAGMVLGCVGVSVGAGSICDGSVSSGGAYRISSTINFSTSSLYIKKGNSSTVFSA